MGGRGSGYVKNSWMGGGIRSAGQQSENPSEPCQKPRFLDVLSHRFKFKIRTVSHHSYKFCNLNQFVLNHIFGFVHTYPVLCSFLLITDPQECEK